MYSDSLLGEELKREVLKLRIRENTIRFRLGQTELEEFLREGALSSSIVFPGAIGKSLTYGLKIFSGKSAEISFEDGSLECSLSDELVKKWSRVDEVGIYEEVAVGSGHLKLIVEKDFECLVARNEEDEDAFPNPEKQSG